MERRRRKNTEPEFTRGKDFERLKFKQQVLTLIEEHQLRKRGRSYCNGVFKVAFKRDPELITRALLILDNTAEKPRRKRGTAESPPRRRRRA